ncbi:phenoloxidase-activating factor 2 [Sitodiplosis mosellana]|uniref:phenoloxidase-activating factor 2 n=1 Tax=Sitodiplosis mosellana TaxID=263140 RepID=UPI002444D668|nr:phenoloxidase-activating factor 2 [Sitodiplosis mosellana]XP_055316156.1 phenoloxidase-activating factor 2 [Sitodiplosis mosellana]XP_055316157.1 phenoloxidase-activating factor 2 [Sitodiplosis mosellana]XP_055316158.1 phenoloxidase-activating factor 2 [Sitodiplosis mosellana]XP_055316159.1 phenoloxidase-activating factor 2 [Sitodiplosis mosellana]
MKAFLLFAVISLSVIYAVNATPQRNRRQEIQSHDKDSAIQGTIDTIFNPPNGGQEQQQQSQPRTQSSRSAGFVVTPDPTYMPTTAPQTSTVNQQNCTCVPYHLCDPNINMVGETANESKNEVTGFGKINVQYDPLDCVDVLDVCCVGAAQRNVSLVPKLNENVTTQEAGCGVRNVDGLDFELAGAFDNEAGFGEFPWTLALIETGVYNKYICGGSLIHPKAALTGFHCVKDFVTKAKDLKVRSGEWDTQTTKERLPYQERTVLRILGHPEYTRSLANDFAIIELEEPFQMDRHISTVCLPPPGFVANQKECFASGWGKDNFGQEGKYSVIMKKVPLSIVDRNQCERALQAERLGDKFRLDGSFICAGGVEGVDTCQGDGGAPLVCPIGRPSDNRFAQNGIVAWGLGCKRPIPAVYANVAQARDWIDGQMRLIGLDTNYYTFRG